MKMISLRKLLYWVVPVLSLAAFSNAQAAFIETFDNGSDDGDWHLTSDTGRLLVIEPTGGNPGAYIHGQVSAGAPVWYVPLGTLDTHFLGNYAARDIGAMSCDINIFSGTEAPERAVTLDIQTTFGTGDFSKGVDAYYIGRNISKLPVGWHTYSFPVDSASTTIPPGWVVTRGNGHPGDDQDWQRLMQDVETMGFILGKPGYVYPLLNIWDLGLDNVRLAHRHLLP